MNLSLYFFFFLQAYCVLLYSKQVKFTISQGKRRRVGGGEGQGVTEWGGKEKRFESMAWQQGRRCRREKGRVDRLKGLMRGRQVTGVHRMGRGGIREEGTMVLVEKEGGSCRRRGKVVWMEMGIQKKDILERKSLSLENFEIFKNKGVCT